MYAELSIVVQLSVGLVFLVSGVAKGRRSRDFARGLAEYDVLPESLAYPAGILVIAVEVALAMSHLSGLAIAPALRLGVALLSIFLAVNIVLLMRGKDVPCLCFGSAHEQVSGRTVMRLLALLCAEFYLILGSAENPISALDTLSPMGVVYALLDAALAIAVVSWLFALPEIGALIRSCKACGRH